MLRLSLTPGPALSAAPRTAYPPSLGTARGNTVTDDAMEATAIRLAADLDKMTADNKRLRDELQFQVNETTDLWALKARAEAQRDQALTELRRLQGS